MRSLSQWSLALAAVLCLAATTPAQEKADPSTPLDRKALDDHVYKTLRDVINHGADLYNSGDQSGCYRLYEGALMTLKPLLDHRPTMQKTIDDALANANRDPRQGRRAFILRQAIDAIRADINPKLAPLWERLGGEKAVRQVVQDFIKLAAANPAVDFTRKDKFKVDVKDLEQKLVEFISANTGGPLKYKGKDMAEVHKGMGITDEQFNASAVDLKKALEDNKVKAADIDELLKIVETTRKAIVEKP